MLFLSFQKNTAWKEKKHYYEHGGGRRQMDGFSIPPPLVDACCVCKAAFFSPAAPA